MRRWLPIALFLALAGLLALAWRREHAQPAPLPTATTPATAVPSAELAQPPDARGTQRDAMPAAAPGESARAQSAPLTPSVTVHLIGQQSRKPLAGLEVHLGYMQDPLSSEVSTDPGLVELTDATGTAVLHPQVSERRPLLTVFTREGGIASNMATLLDPITAESRVEFTLEIPDGHDTHVFGLVLDAQSQAPIAGARVELRDGFSLEHPPQTCTSGRDGRFEFVYTSWASPFLRVESEGFGLRLANPAGHDDPAHPLLVHLARAASLELLVRDPANAPVAGVRVTLTATSAALELEPGEGAGFFMREYVSAPESTWSAETRADGRASIGGLPAGVELRSVLSWHAVRTHLDPEPLKLEPGETRALEVRFEGNTRIRGLALDQEGRPITKLEIRLSACNTEPLQRSLLVENSQVHARARTDELGRFELETPGPGCWILTPWRGDGPDSIAAQPLRVATAGEGEVAVKLSCFRGLFLTGVVLDPGDNPVANARVEAYAEGEWFWGDMRTGADGRFRLGPVTKDEFTLLAYGRDGLADAAPRRARAVNEEIMLRLQLAGALRGRVVDGATGAGFGGQLLYTPETRGYGPFGSGGMIELEDDGSFVIGTLLPGRYGLCAMSADGRFAEQSGIEVVAGRESAGLVLALAPGGKLSLHYSGSKPQVFVRVTRNGVPVHFDQPLASGARALLQAPAGDLVLEVRDDPLGEPRRIPVSLAAGANLELEIGD